MDSNICNKFFLIPQNFPRSHGDNFIQGDFVFVSPLTLYAIDVYLKYEVYRITSFYEAR